MVHRWRWQIFTHPLIKVNINITKSVVIGFRLKNLSRLRYLIIFVIDSVNWMSLDLDFAVICFVCLMILGKTCALKGVCWNWLYEPSGYAINNSLILFIINIELSEHEADRWSWSLDPQGSFIVNQLLLSFKISQLTLLYWMWAICEIHGFLLKLMCVFGGLLLIDFQPLITSFLPECRLYVSSFRPLYNLVEENLAHGLFDCIVVKPFWAKLLSWWKFLISFDIN